MSKQSQFPVSAVLGSYCFLQINVDSSIYSDSYARSAMSDAAGAGDGAGQYEHTSWTNWSWSSSRRRERPSNSVRWMRRNTQRRSSFSNVPTSSSRSDKSPAILSIWLSQTLTQFSVFATFFVVSDIVRKSQLSVTFRAHFKYLITYADSRPNAVITFSVADAAWRYHRSKEVKWRNEQVLAIAISGISISCD